RINREIPYDLSSTGNWTISSLTSEPSPALGATATSRVTSKSLAIEDTHRSAPAKATIDWSENYYGGICTSSDSHRQPRCGLGIGLCHAATRAIADHRLSSCRTHRRPLHTWICSEPRTGERVRRGRNHSADVRSGPPLSREGSARRSQYRRNRSPLSERNCDVPWRPGRPDLRVVLGGQHSVWARSVGGEYRYAHKSTYR